MKIFTGEAPKCMKDNKRRNLCIRACPVNRKFLLHHMDSSHNRKALFFFLQKISLLCYPFRPEVLIPSTRYFWKNRKMITAGRTESVAIANIAP